MPIIEASFAQAETANQGESVPAPDMAAAFDQWIARRAPIAIAAPAP